MLKNMPISVRLCIILICILSQSSLIFSHEMTELPLGNEEDTTKMQGTGSDSVVKDTVKKSQNASPKSDSSH